MRWETRNSWSTHLRLAAWSKKSYSYNDRKASLSFNKMRKKQTEETVIASQQQQIADRREQDRIRREEELRQAKENSVSMEQYLADHPDSNLRKFSTKEN